MPDASAPLFPPLLWAQRPEYVLVTVALQDTKDVGIELKDEGSVLHISCRAADAAGCMTRYSCDVRLFARVVPEESTHAVRPRQVELKLKKAWNAPEGEEPKEEDINWPRLTSETKKHPRIQVDWAHWVQEEDEDEMAEREMNELGDFGMSDDELLSTLSMKEEGVKDAAERMNVAPSTFPGFGSAAGQKPIPDEEIMNAEDEDEMPPLEEA
eukprot:gene6360-4585_t